MWGFETGAGETPQRREWSVVFLSRHGLGVKTEIVLPVAAEWRAERQGPQHQGPVPSLGFEREEGSSGLRGG